MSEELNETGVLTPAPETPEPISDAPEAAVTPVTPAPEAAPSIPAVAPESVQVPAAAEPAPAEVLETPNAEPQTEPAKEIAPTDDAADFVVLQDHINRATDAIKATGRSSIPFLQRTLELTNGQTLKVIDRLVELGILGDYKDPRNKMTPRVILIPTDKPAADKPSIKITVNKKKPMRPKVTDLDRLESWKKHLKEIGGYTDNEFIGAMSQFALKNQGFNPQAKWGSCLIVMVNRFATKLRDSLRTFTWSDSEYVMRELLRFTSEQPLGDGPMVWNSRFSSNMEQKNAVSEFFGINCSFREMRGKQCQVMTAIRDAAWPTRDEEQKGTGGTFAERFHYLALCLVAFGSSDHHKALFENSIHDQPTERFLERIGGGAPRQRVPEWHKDGKCLSCGFDVTTDSNGNTICSNPMCMKHYAMAATDTSSFRNGGNRHDRGGVEVDPNSVPLPTTDHRRKNWKKDRHDNDDGDEMPRGWKKGGKRQRFRESDEELPDTIGGGDPVYSTGGSSGEEFRNNAFDGLDALTGSSDPNPNPEGSPAE